MVFFGWALVQAPADEGIDPSRLPVSSLAIVVVPADMAST